VLFEHPGIAEVYAIGRQGHNCGEDVRAIAVKVHGAELTEQKVIDYGPSPQHTCSPARLICFNRPICGGFP